MNRVNHKTFGVGEVIGREIINNTSIITVRFENGKESVFSIPESFTLGIMTAEGSLKEEVETAIAEKKLREQDRLQSIHTTVAEARSSSASGGKRKSPVPVAVKGAIETAYETFLINAGYETVTPAGAPSTVYSYSGAITRHVLEEEHITWGILKNNIDDILKKYDVGGAKEHIGAKSNKTVINALKRFKEFVSLNP